LKAAQAFGPHEIKIADLPIPDAQGQVLIRSKIVGICGTDVKVVEGALPVEYPRVLGHEMIGEVVEAPADSHVQPGDRVLVDPASSCGHCDLCMKGRQHLCRNAGLMGREVDGVFAEYVRVPSQQVLPVPASISDKASGLLQVLGTCIHAQKAVQVFPGQVVAVIGLGVAGQLMVQLLKARGVTVVGITRSEWKRDLAAQYGATITSSPDEAEAVLADLTDGCGPDLVVEAVGHEKTLIQAIELVSIGGKVLVFGTLTGGTEGLPYYQLYYKELSIYNPRAALPADYALGINLAAKDLLTLEPIVTHQLGLDETVKAFELVSDPSSLKVLMSV